MAAMVGINLSIIGVFYRPLSSGLNVAFTQIALYTTFQTLSKAVTLPFIGKIMSKVNLKYFLSLVAVIMCGIFALTSLVTSLIQLYIIAAAIGVCGGVALYMAVPALLNAWFKSRLGFAMGIAMACQGIGGAIFNPIASNLISVFGWRQTFWTMAVISLVLVLPFTLFVIKNKPEDIGLTAYGSENAGTGKGGSETANKSATVLTGITAKEAWSQPAFYLIIVVIISVAFTAAMQTHVANFAIASGISAAQSGFFVSACSIGMICGNPILGYLNDRIGIAKAAAVFCVLGITAGIVGTMSAGNMPLVFATSFFLGMAIALLSVEMPLIVKATFGLKDFNNIYSRLMMVNSVLISISVIMIASLYDISGNYNYVFYVIAAIQVICGIVVFVVERAGKKINTGEVNSAA
jgi:MFS family permease